jgi:hypothetical protein
MLTFWDVQGLWKLRTCLHGYLNEASAAAVGYLRFPRLSSATHGARRFQSNEQVARSLFLTENTVESHLRRINTKLGTRTRMQAIARARDIGAI